MTALYWVIEYKPGTHTTATAWVKDIGNHGYPLAFLLFEFFINLIPFYFRHIFIMLGYIIVYLLINLGISVAI